MTVYLYKLAAPSYDDSEPHFLQHEQHFTPEEFEAKVLGYVPEVAREEYRRHKDAVAPVEARTGRKHDVYVMWNHVIGDIANALCEREGFSPLEWTASYCPRGMTVIIGETYWQVDNPCDCERRLWEHGRGAPE